MPNFSGSVSLSDLLAGGKSAVMQWIVNVPPGQQSLSQKFDWLGLAEAAALNARFELDLDWAKIAISIYDQLAKKVESKSQRESLMYSQMNLRAFLIARLGAVPGHPILDPQPIINWFFDSLTLTVEEASERAARWTDLEIERVRELRRIKNRLSPIKVLKEANMLPHDSYSSLSSWLSIRSQLP